MSTGYSKEQTLHIWVEVANGRGRHGSFLRSFAEAVMRADPDNFANIEEVADLLAEKYGLYKYLDNFEAVQ